MKLEFNYTIQSLNPITGKPTKQLKVHNTVVDSGRNRVRDLIGELSGTGFTYLGIGTDNTSETTTDLELGTEYTRENVTPSPGAIGVLEYDHTFTVASGVSEDITEAGLLDQALVSGSVLLNRATFSAFTLDSDNPLRIIATITITTT